MRNFNLKIPSQVTLKTISNNWSINNEQAQEVLNKWLEKNSKSAKNCKTEFLVRGKNSKGILSFGVVDEAKKNKLAEKWTNFSAWLYSIDATVNSRKLGLPDLTAIKV